jgi:hypothetical protein
MITTELTTEQSAIQTAIATVYPDVEIRWDPLEWDTEWLINLSGYADLKKGTEHPSLILPFTYLVDHVGRRHSIQVNCSLVTVEAGGLGAVQDCFLLESFRLTSTGRKYKRQSDVFGKIKGRSRFPLDSYFIYTLPGGSDKFPNFDAVRRWRWRLRQGETIALIHGDWAFIPKENPKGTSVGTSIDLGGADITSDKILRKGDRLFVLNPVSYNDDLDMAELTGWYEVRLGRRWANDWESEEKISV